MIKIPRSLRLRIRKIRLHATCKILPHHEYVSDEYRSTICSFPSAYSIGRLIIDVCNELKLRTESARILIVGPAGGRDYHWLKGFGFSPETLDLGHHPWGATKYIGDACVAETWEIVGKGYDLIIMGDILEHLPRDYDVLCYVRQALMEKGALLLSVPYHHNIEPTHVHVYSDATLSRLLGIAGFGVVWKKQRPGMLEAFPYTLNLINYLIALLTPSSRIGGNFLSRLLRAEYLLNDATRRFWWYVTRSSQKGMIYLCSLKAMSDYVDRNRNAFIPGTHQD